MVQLSGEEKAKEVKKRNRPSQNPKKIWWGGKLPKKRRGNKGSAKETLTEKGK